MFLAPIHRDMGTEPAAKADDQPTEPFSEEGVTLEPHPYELQRAVNADHVVVFQWTQDGTGYQFEVSGEPDDEGVDLDWQNVTIPPAVAAAVVNDDTTFTDTREDDDENGYTIRVRGGARHPKGTPIHTQAATEDEA